MGERLSNYIFKGRGFHQLYPWDEWLDGSIWRITRGEDFAIEAGVMRRAVIATASRRGKRVRTNVDGESVVFQVVGEVPHGA